MLFSNQHSIFHSDLNTELLQVLANCTQVLFNNSIMNTRFKQYIPEDFNDNSRVWIYQSNRQFTSQEVEELEKKLEHFSSVWNSHGSAVKSFAKLFYDHFIILMADETNVKVGGCSTDSSFRFIKNIEKDYEVDLLDRQTLAFIVKNKIYLIPLEDINYSIENEIINPETLYFNNTILTKRQLLDNWIIPVKDSWLAKRIPSSHL